MKFPIAICLALIVGRIDCENKRLREIFSWKIMDYAWDKPEDREAAIASQEFIPSNNLILGLDRWKNKLFVTVPRWKAGVVSTLNYINISEDEAETPPPDATTTPLPPEETTAPPPPDEETITPPPPPEEETTPPPPPEEETPPPPPEEETPTPPPEEETPPPLPEEETPPPLPPALPNPEAPLPDDDATPPPSPEEDDDDDDDEEDEEDPPPDDVLVISGEEALRANVLSMRRLISNFEFVDPSKLTRKSTGEKSKKSKSKSSKKKSKGTTGKNKGKGTNKGKKKPCRPKPKPTTVATPTTEPPPPPTSPALIPYPSFEANRLKPNRDPNDPVPIVSVFRVRVDPCDRLWVMDSGVADILDKHEKISKSRILIYDLNTDKLIKEYQLKDSDTSENSFFANIIVDVTADTCDKAFAYLPDLGGYAIVVYDLANDKSYKLTHNFFHFDPLAGDMTVGGQNFQWTDGIFSVALTKPDDKGVRDAYFHALASTKEFKVKTDILQKEDGKDSYYEYKLVGDRGKDSQSSASFIHEDTGVMFYTQLQKDSINCWNTNKKLIPENLAEVASDNETMIFTNDLKVDADSNLWVLTDKLPIFIYNKLDDDEVNYRIFTAPVKDAITGTSCAP